MQAPTDPAESMLESACELLRHDWVKSFLFPTDRTTYVRQLHHALSQESAITADVHFGTQSSSVGPCQSLPGLNKKLSLLCATSFSTGNITVGFEVTECLADSTPHPLGLPRYIGRFVRDDEEGLMFIIAEHPHLGVTQVTCCTLLSPGCRSQMYAVMNLRQLRAVVSNVEKGKGYDRAAMRRATMFAYFSVDMRACPNCGSNTVALCGCMLKVQRKAHPMDHDAELHNLSTYTGDFGGLAKMRVLEDGRDTSVASFVSKIEAIFTCDRERQRNMATWAMTFASTNEPVRLENYQMPQGRMLIEHGDGSDETTAGEESVSSKDVLNESVRERVRRKQREAASSLPVRRRIRRTVRRGVVRSTPPPAGFPRAHVEEVKVEVEQQGSGGAGASGCGCNWSKPPLPTLVPVAVGAMYQQGAGFGVQQAQAIPLAPGPRLGSGRMLRDERSKDEIRRARNRASAQRSNEKKKREVAKLRDDLQAFGELKRRLVERERALRDENAVLRAALGKAAVLV